MNRIKIDKGFVIDVLRSALIALIVSIILIIAFAFVLNALDLSGAVIDAVNGAVKLISILAGAFFGVKNLDKGVLKGVFIGLIFLLLSVLLMKVFNAELKAPPFTALNVCLSVLFGAVSGIFAVNFKKR
ncbi:MAG: TIGR04086 family membrane protein [Clostridiales bacterium]|jgi:putative membrane protein (TIGR04086 family)|nr:TIGR04086 family membrane protein [Clostridiales bacterium]